MRCVILSPYLLGTSNYTFFQWVPLIRRSNPSLKVIIGGMAPGGGSIRPGPEPESLEELERICSEDGAASEKKTRPFISFVSRGRGLAAARSVGASAYFECSELSCGDLDRMISALIGAGAAARMEYMQHEAAQRASATYYSPRGSTAAASVQAPG